MLEEEENERGVRVHSSFPETGSRRENALPHLVLSAGRSRGTGCISSARGRAPARGHGVFCELAKDESFFFGLKRATKKEE